MMKYISDQFDYNIITVEDPIEFLFTSSKSCVIQREVGIDTDSFTVALRSAMRMNPDVIMVGEMRDLETVDACVKAAETGHLVLSTLHTPNTASTINRIVGYFPPEAQRIPGKGWQRVLPPSYPSGLYGKERRDRSAGP